MKSSVQKAAFFITLMFAASTTAVIAQEHQQTDQQIAARLPSGSRFLFFTHGLERVGDGLLVIRHGGLRSNVTDPTITIGRPQVTIPFTGSYTLGDTHQELNNVNGVITIVRWSGGAAITISFTVNIVIALPGGKTRATGQIKVFDGAIQLGFTNAAFLIAGTYTLDTPPVRGGSTSGGVIPGIAGGGGGGGGGTRVTGPEPRPGPFPFFAREIR